jgi:pimeloyl-ACP methyl ester carboxylesterase
MASTLAMALTLGLVAAACSGGGGDTGKGGDDIGLTGGSGEVVLQFEGAGKLHLGGTLSMPDRAAKPGPSPLALIVPTTARNDRNGYIDVVPDDPIYQDLSKAIVASGTAAFRYDRRVSTPGRPLVDVMADALQATNGAESAAAFRSTIATLLTTGALPDRLSIRPEHQTALPTGQDALLKAVYSLDPVAEAAKVRVPTLIVTGTRSTTVNGADAARLAGAIPGAQLATADATASLQNIIPALPQAFDPNDHLAHSGGVPPDTATRDQAALNQITSFLNSKASGTHR